VPERAGGLLERRRQGLVEIVTHRQRRAQGRRCLLRALGRRARDEAEGAVDLREIEPE
jgi:hypothetical protein